MDDHVEAELDRPLDPRTGEGVVGNRDDFVLARFFGDGFEIDDFEPESLADEFVDLGDNKYLSALS